MKMNAMQMQQGNDIQGAKAQYFTISVRFPVMKKVNRVTWNVRAI